MDGLSGKLTSGAVLARLRGLRLDVSAKQLDNDTRDGFLPPRESRTRGGVPGRSGEWEPWMFRRAEMLYRLRKIKTDDGKPAISGDVLRLVLFLRDGWGWRGRLMRACLRGLDKSVAGELTPVAKYTKRYRDNEDIASALEQHEVTLAPGDQYAIGMSLNGEPLDGTMRPLYNVCKQMGLLHGLPQFAMAIAGFLGFEPSEESEAFGGELIMRMLLGFGLGAGATRGLAPAFRSIIENLTDDAAREALPSFRQVVRDLRRYIHQCAKEGGQRGFASNPITMFGQRQRAVERLLKEAPRRITAAQALALFVGVGIAAHQVLIDFARNAGFLTTVLSTILTSADNTNLSKKQ